MVHEVCTCRFMCFAGTLHRTVCSIGLEDRDDRLVHSNIVILYIGKSFSWSEIPLFLMLLPSPRSETPATVFCVSHRHAPPQPTPASHGSWAFVQCISTVHTVPPHSAQRSGHLQQSFRACREVCGPFVPEPHFQLKLHSISIPLPPTRASPLTCGLMMASVCG